MNMQDFMTPPKHVNFRARKLFGEMGRIVDGSIAYIDLNVSIKSEKTILQKNCISCFVSRNAVIKMFERLCKPIQKYF